MSELQDYTDNQIATLLTPCTVSLVTAKDEQGDCVATCAWVNPLSHSPSLIGVCLRPQGRTAQAIETCGGFVVNVLSSNQKEIALLCGKKGEGQPERFETAGLTKLPAQMLDSCRVEQACAWIECELVESKVFGDHKLYVGRTLIAQSEGCVQPLLMSGRSAFGHFEEE